MKALTWKSKVFLTALVNGLIGSTMLVVVRFHPEEQVFVNSLWEIWQPMVVVIIAIVSGEEAIRTVRSWRGLK